MMFTEPLIRGFWCDSKITCALALADNEHESSTSKYGVLEVHQKRRHLDPRYVGCVDIHNETSKHKRKALVHFSTGFWYSSNNLTC